MVDDSRIGIYNYIYDLLYGVVTENVYRMSEPQELTESDTKDGFLVITLGDVYDESEFSKQAYGWARAYIEVYVPPRSRGRLDKAAYKAFEDAVNTVIDTEVANPTNDTYSIQTDSVISMDGEAGSGANNSYFVFVKSFVVLIDKEESSNNNN